MTNPDSAPEVAVDGIVCTQAALRVPQAITWLSVYRQLHTTVEQLLYSSSSKSNTGDGIDAQQPARPTQIPGFATFGKLVLCRHLVELHQTDLFLLI